MLRKARPRPHDLQETSAKKVFPVPCRCAFGDSDMLCITTRQNIGLNVLFPEPFGPA